MERYNVHKDDFGQQNNSRLNCSSLILVVAKIHAHLDGPLKDVTQAEDAICAAYEKLIGSCIWTEERSRVPELGPLQVIAVRKGGSIVLYLWCKAGEKQPRLHFMMTSGQFKETVERLLNRLLTQSQKVAVKTITMNDEDFRRLEAYFAGDHSFLYQVKTFYIKLKLLL